MICDFSSFLEKYSQNRSFCGAGHFAFAAAEQNEFTDERS